MKKKLLLLLLSFCSVTLFPQTAHINTYGRSPIQVDSDSTDMFNIPYNGLTNVGIQTQMYLEVSLDGAHLTNPMWNVIQKPAGSNPQFGTSTNLTDSNQVIIFVPDSTGKYKINFTDGSVISDTLTINAGLYLGYTGGQLSCGTCHGSKVDEWRQTGHYMIFEEGLNGTLSSHYGPSCIKCHTTGYDENADNNGFDDFPFVFPDSLYPGVYDQMVAQYPLAMQRGRIQCESCHGPGSEHYGAANVMSATLAVENCAWCHDGGHHVFPSQWRVSKHATFEHGMTRASCAQCHNGAGFVEYIESGKQPIAQDLAKVVPITCAVCHDPHSVENPHQLRTMDVTLSDGETVEGGGNGTICMNCHKARQNAVEYTNDYLNNLSTHYGPHHGPQADILSAKNAVTFGRNIPSSPHLAATGDACVTCHMYPGTTDPYGNIILVGSHTFSMSHDSVDNVQACSPCHGNIGTSFSDKKYYVNGNADLDGDGVANGLQIEVQGLLNQLKSMLPQDSNGNVTINDSSVTLPQAQAAYDYLMVTEDRSYGIHNPAFVYGILKASIEALGGVVAAGNDKNQLPHDFELSQNYPNPFNPTTTIEYKVPEASNVKIIVYDALGKQVEVLADGYQNAGTYTLNFDGSNLASGIYLCRMEAKGFVKVNKMLLLK